MILSVLFFHAVAVLFGAAFFEYDFGDLYFFLEILVFVVFAVLM